MYNLGQTVDHLETKKMLKNINQYNADDMNQDLEYELDAEAAATMTVEEEFRERVRRAEKKEKAIA
jgi:hypothetical protein